MTEPSGIAVTTAKAGAANPRRLAAGQGSILRPTKAETLEALRLAAPDLEIPEFVHFRASAWRSDREAVLRRVLAALGAERLAIRSSTRGEDEPGSGRAGHFLTLLDVGRDPQALATAIDRVIASYEGHPEDRVLVQEMARGVVAAGVLATRDPADGGPYLVFESQRGPRTDLVTGGAVNPRRAVVHRSIAPCSIADESLRGIARLAARVERLAGRQGLEVELAERPAGPPVVLQVRGLGRDPRDDARHDALVADALRELATSLEERFRPSAALAGTSTLLGQMPDWNPAELIGTLPSPLAASLFGSLVGDDVWQRARAAIGYQPVPGTRLVTMLAGRPWVDVRASFNSFLPAGLDPETRSHLVDAWLDRLRARPELHDKVEFEVIQSARDFSFGSTLAARFDGALPATAIARWTAALGELTARLVRLDRGASLPRALATAAELGAMPLGSSGDGLPLARAARLLADARERGALPFATAARHAFVAESLLRSAVERGAFGPARLADFRASIRTVAGEVASGFAAVRAGRSSRRLFLARWGYLRPATFDVTSARYDARPDLFDEDPAADDATSRTPAEFVVTPAERAALDRLAREAGLAVDGDGLLRWARSAIAGREFAKSTLSRHVSAVLEGLAAWAASAGLGRDDLAHLSLPEVLAAGDHPGPGPTGALRRRIAERREKALLHRRLRLGVLLAAPSDVHVVTDAPGTPTFVTSRRIAASPALVGPATTPHARLRGRIACIESADPGFDWIFGSGAVALATRFGGANSHMAIRCHELGLPAAIGLGDLAFERLVRTSRVELHCGEQAVRCLLPDASA